jgi:hypothetical protein
VRFADTDACVFDREAHQQIVAALLDQSGTDADGAALGELDRVAGEVEQGLAQARRITAQPRRHAVVVDLDREPLATSRFGDARRAAIKRFPFVSSWAARVIDGSDMTSLPSR